VLAGATGLVGGAILRGLPPMDRSPQFSPSADDRLCSHICG
jgi:hypothetical protein